jgi:hypothetical protein
MISPNPPASVDFFQRNSRVTNQRRDLEKGERETTMKQAANVPAVKYQMFPDEETSKALSEMRAYYLDLGTTPVIVFKVS